MMKFAYGFVTAAVTAAMTIAASAAPPPPSATPDMKTFKLEVSLDRLGFSPGVIDGRPGQTLKIAISGFQKSRGLPVTGTLDAATMQALGPLGQISPLATVTLNKINFDQGFTPTIPHNEDAQAKLPALGYKNIMELLAERYHTTPATLAVINGSKTIVAPGAKIRVPNVVEIRRAYPTNLSQQWRDTLNGLNVPSDVPQADHISVSKSGKALSVFDKAGKLVAQFPVTTGSGHDPLPIGNWKIVAADYNPKFHFNPALFWDASKGDKKAMLPPGPNGPVGVVWLDLSKAHYGIHGTPEPQNIGRTESHGCVRLTNWDVARLALMVKAGTPVTFEP